ncbi:winged helix-turn-helix domain-containing protein [bacterium]|nr:winged helix-turn-helix domain-containing protein [bacterium]
MSIHPAKKSIYIVDAWVIKPELNIIITGDSSVRVEPKAMDVLVYMLDRPGETVTREEFFQVIWKDSFVTENTLNQIISKLRKIFNDETAQPRVIETVSKKGYRIIAAVEKKNENNGDAANEPKSLWMKVAAGLAVLAVLAAIIAGREYFFVDKFTEPVILSSATGMERFPFLSYDGKKVVFIYGNSCDEKTEVRVLTPGSDQVEIFAQIPGFKKFPRFSRDGQSIIFCNTVGWNSVSEAVSTVYRINLPDTSLIDILTIPSQIRGLDWSPDGRWITYSTRPDSTSPFSLYLADVEGKTITQITSPPQKHMEDRYPVFFNDGRSIAFARFDTDFDNDIWVIEISTGELRRLTSDRARVVDVTSDGDQIFYTRSGTNSINAIVRLNPVTLEKTLLAKIACSSLSVRGRRIVFAYHLVNDDVMSLIDLKTKSGVDFFESNYGEVFPEFSPDGRSVIFISNREGDLNLWKGNVQDVIPRRVSFKSLSLASYQPRWSPDGKNILFDTFEDGQFKIYKTPVDEDQPRVLIEDAASPVFSNDGKYIYFNSKRSGTSQIWKVPVDGGDAVQVTFKGGLIGYESVADSAFYFVKEGLSGIWKLKNGIEELFFTDLQSNAVRNWRLTEKGIYFAKSPPDQIYYLDLKTKALHLIISYPCQGYTNGLSISPDGEKLLWSRVQQFETDIRMIEWK